MSASRRYTLGQMFETLQRACGPQMWWPADTPTEVAIGAILTQNTSWKNVEKAVAAMKAADLLDFCRIDAVSESELADVIRPAGTYRVKARRLKALARWVCRRAGGSIERALEGELSELRRELLTVRGVGPETADSILLYAGRHPTFVVDAYTRRVLRRHAFIGSGADYAAIQARFETALPRSAEVFNEFHALLVEIGKRHCRTRARCKGCPLETWPHDSNAA